MLMRILEGFCAWAGDDHRSTPPSANASRARVTARRNGAGRAGGTARGLPWGRSAPGAPAQAAFALRGPTLLTKTDRFHLFLSVYSVRLPVRPVPYDSLPARLAMNVLPERWTGLGHSWPPDVAFGWVRSAQADWPPGKRVCPRRWRKMGWWERRN